MKNKSKFHVAILTFCIIAIAIMLALIQALQNSKRQNESIIKYFNITDKKAELYPSKDIELADITSEQMLSDLKSLDEVLMFSSTDAILYKDEYKNYYLSQFENLPKNPTPTLVDFYKITSRSPVQRDSHSRIFEPNEVIKSRFRGGGFLNQQLEDSLNIKKNRNWIKLLNHELDKTGSTENLVNNQENQILLTDNGTNGPKPEMKIIEEGKTASIRFRTFFLEKSLRNEYKDFAKKIENYKYLIIDIRGNKGGYIYPWLEFLEEILEGNYNVESYFGFRDSELSRKAFEDFSKSNRIKEDFKSSNYKTSKVDKLPDSMTKTDAEHLKELKHFIKLTDTLNGKSKNPFKGKVYVLMNRSSFSSTDLFAQYIKKTGVATLVGENTGGGGNITGDYIHAMPYTGLMYRVEVAYLFNDDGSSNARWGTPPDINAPSGLELDYVLNNLIQ